MATFLGMVFGFGILGLSIYLSMLPTPKLPPTTNLVEQAIRSFINIPSILCVMGGSLGATLASFTVGDITRTIRSFIVVFIRGRPKFINKVDEISVISRDYAKEGTAALESRLKKMPGSVLKDGLSFLISGYNRDEIRKMMEDNIRMKYDREKLDVDVLRTIAATSPAFGMLGTLIGLILMLGNIDDPSTIGPNMAVALVTTFYGVVLAHALFNPMAEKLSYQAEDNIIIGEMEVEGMLMIIEKRHPVYIKDRLSAYVPPGQRGKLFKTGKGKPTAEKK